MNMELFKIIYLKVLELNLACGFNRTDEDLQKIANVLVKDLKDEKPQTIIDAFDRIRQSAKFWPKVSEILDACNYVRKSEQYDFSKESFSTRAIPGIAWVADKFLREGRSVEDFKAAQVYMREVFESYQAKNLEWTLEKSEILAIISDKFGDRPAQEGLLVQFAS